MVRVAGLKRRRDMGLSVTSADGLTASEQLALISARTQELVDRQGRCFTDDVLPALADAGIRIVHWGPIDPRGPGAAGRVLHLADLPGADAAGRRSGAPVPVHLRAQPEHGDHRARPGDQGRAVRPGQGAEQRRPVRPGAPRGQRLPAARGPDRRAPGRAVPGHGCGGAPGVPGHPQRRPRGRGGPRRGPAAGAGTGTGPPPVRAAGPAGDHRHHQRAGAGPAAHRARRRPGRRGRSARAAGPFEPVAAVRAGPADAEGPAVRAGDQPGVRRGRDPEECLRHAAGRGCAAAPPVRVVRDHGAAVHRAGRRRPAGAGDQADPVPHLRRLPHRRRADLGGRGRQAGGRAGGDQGPVRRAGQHLLGQGAGTGRGARRLRPGRASRRTARPRW